MTVATEPGRLAQSYRTRPGQALPLGATPVPGGVNFSVSSRTARGMWLVLMDAGTGATLAELPFPDGYRVGSVFTMTVLGVDPALVSYGFRVAGADGALSPVLLDPYANGLAGSGPWGDRPRYRSQIVVEDFDWGDDARPDLAPEDLVIYEAHVRGFTRHPSARVSSPGTYRGLQEKIPYLRELGITCVELLPVAEFDETDNTYTSPESGAPLRNYWGYNTVGFFAPKAAYATDHTPAGASTELKELVRALHRAGIKVVLDVVLNHTAEGDHRGPTLSFRALDESAYYLLTPEGEYRNLTATGNTVNANHPTTRAMILDCLRSWVTRYHVDGFRFDMASILARGTDGRLLRNPPLLEAIAHDPVLADCLLIAEATDATGVDQVGTFPAYDRWSEWNGRYRDGIRRFLLGRPGSAGEFATRLVGSPDLYRGRGTAASVNYITCHDGLTLADWVSYDRRHNEANGEGGLDGIPDEDSWNCGEEGPTDDPGVQRLRQRQQRNALLLLLMSQGIPMLLAGDEIARTQQGNNNAYSQDSPLSWVDWSHTDTHSDLLRFVRHCTAFRRAHPVLRRPRHPGGELPAGWSHPPVSWHGETAHRPDWSSSSTLLAVLLHQQDEQGRSDTVFLAANSGDGPRSMHPPAPPPGTRWHLCMDTGATPGSDSHPPGRQPALDGGTLRLADHSVAVLAALPDDRT
ncbi:glycogen debranching protein GlgX [Kitasatospora atroaurantiaca]|uniref:Glycogen operon protein n=1 Tax=Kitasatospora atroaurantiaca TaxID=285545 RepID=A0A561EXQ9_9ACTN|nr:alpha-amylase family glycosyl hydrolase [Kitasatospora atroaurantiaca]TWE20400.1 glycogen operon protein [Kitasatospora atroaurantiaca]